MSLYSHGFQFLPRPARSIFSLGDEQTRSQLPDFNSVDELAQFVHRLFVYKVDIVSFFVQVKVGSCMIAFLMLVIVLIVVRRMYDRSFWLVRIMKRPSGPVIVVSPAGVCGAKGYADVHTSLQSAQRPVVLFDHRSNIRCALHFVHVAAKQLV